MQRPAAIAKRHGHVGGSPALPRPSVPRALAESHLGARIHVGFQQRIDAGRRALALEGDAVENPQVAGIRFGKLVHEGLADENLAGLGGRREPGRQIHRITEDVVVGVDHRAEMHAGMDGQGTGPFP